jgi:hypothetical protein
VLILLTTTSAWKAVQQQHSFNQSQDRIIVWTVPHVNQTNMRVGYVPYRLIDSVAVAPLATEVIIRCRRAHVPRIERAPHVTLSVLPALVLAKSNAARATQRCFWIRTNSLATKAARLAM